MKGREVLLGQAAGRDVAALRLDGTLIDLLVDPPDHYPYPPETILRGRLDKPMKGQGGAIVKLPNGQGFLRKSKGLAPGAHLNLQVTGTVEPGKAVPLGQRLMLKGQAVIVTPGAPGLNVARSIKDPEIRSALTKLAETEVGTSTDLGVILRSAAAAFDPADIQAELAQLLRLARALAEDAGTQPEVLLAAPGAHERAGRDWCVPRPDTIIDTPKAFEASGVLEQIEALLSPSLPLGGDASAMIEPTRALVAVDVNTGADHSLAAGLKANLKLAQDLPRQLRLRGLAGQVTLDLAPMPKKERRRFEDALRRACRLEGVDMILAGWTPLGHFELQMKRDRWPLRELLSA